MPGAGKTTVTFAIHLVSQSPEAHLLVVCPKNAFSAWDDVIADCLRDDAAMERFIRLEGTDENIRSQLFGGGRRFLINYEKLVACPRVITDYVASRPVHLVLDESHRIKNAIAQRSQALIRIAPLSIRRDILSGTPLPNSAEDLASQLDFLWPGSDLPVRVRDGEAPRRVLQGIYVRVTKSQLGLPPVNRRFVPVRMGEAQYALYGALKDDAIRDILAIRGSGAAELIRAKRSVMRLMQASTNPVAVVEAMLADARTLNRDRVAALYHAVLQEGASEKVLFAAERARELVTQGRKVVIWTIFQSTIESMLNETADLAPIFINGTVESGSADELHNERRKNKAISQRSGLHSANSQSRRVFRRDQPSYCVSRSYLSGPRIQRGSLFAVNR